MTSAVVMMPATLISFGDVQLQLLLATLENAHPRPADRELMSKRVAMMGAAAAAAIQSLTRVRGKAEQSLPALLTVLASTSRQAAEARQAELLAGGPLLPPQGTAQQADQQGLQLLQQVPAAGKGLPLQQQKQLQDSPSAAAVVAEPPSTRRSAEEDMGILLGAEGPSTAAQGGQAGALLARLADKMQLRLLPAPSSQLPVGQAVTSQARHSWMWQAPLNHQARHAAAAEGRSRPSSGSAVACDLDNQLVPRENQVRTGFYSVDLVDMCMIITFSLHGCVARSAHIPVWQVLMRSCLISFPCCSVAAVCNRGAHRNVHWGPAQAQFCRGGRFPAGVAEQERSAPWLAAKGGSHLAVPALWQGGNMLRTTGMRCGHGLPITCCDTACIELFIFATWPVLCPLPPWPKRDLGTTRRPQFPQKSPVLR